ncbi:Protein of unknown function DUF58 [Jatrophihabitans endophyticus]|uniref:DUF58 domain-containing protein n=1 Tax=Jatrophihabitans endophyticus TaxID=1206085 RepID=A0A1M5N652_9ACTN|nr:DUF58 domain-containing protein [Jatrophihabitans endophyticus]SHG84945.1 Protein of unknown function DUF58 [Jatrophihabitans endophyticus]
MNPRNPDGPAAGPVATDHGPTLDVQGADALLRRLELAVRNRLDGLLQGNYQGLVPGPGSEPGESRPYVIGDDVRRMDWPVTARTTTPHIRQTVADRELETWLVVDLSPSMDFGTGRSEKRELVLAALTAVVHLTVRGGNRVGAVVGTGERSEVIPALGGRAHARHLLRRIAQTPRAATGGANDLTRMLEQLRRPQRRRGLVAVVSDFMDGALRDQGAASGEPPPWERALRALSGHHQLLAVEILDPRELELPAAGLVTFVDTESGRELEVQTSDVKVRAQYAEAAAAQRARIAAGLRHAGAAHLQLRTDRDWIADVVRFVVAQRHFVVGAVGAGVR